MDLKLERKANRQISEDSLSPDPTVCRAVHVFGRGRQPGPGDEYKHRREALMYEAPAAAFIMLKSPVISEDFPKRLTAHFDIRK